MRSRTFTLRAGHSPWHLVWQSRCPVLSGFYVDTWLMIDSYSNTVGRGLATDSYRSSTVNGSLEAGYSIPVFQQADTRVFVEPQA
jgi:autotransporter family porin